MSTLQIRMGGREHEVLLMVDHCFATPYLQRPIEHGASIVIHSATKYIDGQGRVLGGAIIGSAALIADDRFCATHGTFHERVQCMGALKVARDAGRAWIGTAPMHSPWRVILMDTRHLNRCAIPSFRRTRSIHSPNARCHRAVASWCLL